MKGEIVHIKVHKGFWKKLKNEATNKGFKTMTGYTKELGSNDKELDSVFTKRNKNVFGF